MDRRQKLRGLEDDVAALRCRFNEDDAVRAMRLQARLFVMMLLMPAGSCWRPLLSLPHKLCSRVGCVCGCSRLKNFCSAVVSYVALALPSDGKRDGEG